MKCWKCGFVIPNNSAICKNCGESVTWTGAGQGHKYVDPTLKGQTNINRKAGEKKKIEKVQKPRIQKKSDKKRSKETKKKQQRQRNTNMSWKKEFPPTTIMKLFSRFSELSGWYRLLIVISIIWVIVALIGTNPWTYSSSRGGSYNNWDNFFLVGILPVAILWGVIWIRQGFKKDKILS